MKLLADHVIARHYPEIEGEPDRYVRLFEAIAARQAALIARWMGVGFIHGVMNTDNMAVSGETIDYGPLRLHGRLFTTKTFSSIDRNGRYAYANQPASASGTSPALPNACCRSSTKCRTRRWKRQMRR